jgi:endonuclease III related protein
LDSGRERGARRIRRIFRTLEQAMGAQHWWPAGSPFEVVVGAYLTQNTAWTNVERAIANLRQAGVLSVEGIRGVATGELERLLRPAGYFRQKAARLKRFVEHLDARHRGSLDAMFATPAEALREELLALNGVGPETADSILLYAASREVFVVDAYTRRIWERHRLAHPGTGYEEIRTAVERALAEPEPSDRGEAGHEQQQHQGQQQLPRPSQQRARTGRPAVAKVGRPPQVQISVHPPSAASEMPRGELSRRYNEFHALLVQTGKHYCRKAAPRCEHCPLEPLLPPGAKPR